MKIAIYQIVPEQDTNRVIFRNMEFVSEKTVDTFRQKSTNVFTAV